jgi:predicted CXXCH cytochrome family protein
MCHEAAEGKGHGPYEQGQCATCHDPHVSEFPFLTRAVGNQMCLECHIDRPDRNAPISLFEVRELSKDEFDQMPKIVLNGTRQLGHPFLGHPVFGPVDPWREGETFACRSCHAPHAAPLPRLLGERWNTVDVCDQCHDAVKQMAKKAQK